MFTSCFELFNAYKWCMKTSRLHSDYEKHVSSVCDCLLCACMLISKRCNMHSGHAVCVSVHSRSLRQLHKGIAIDFLVLIVRIVMCWIVWSCVVIIIWSRLKWKWCRSVTGVGQVVCQAVCQFTKSCKVSVV